MANKKKQLKDSEIEKYSPIYYFEKIIPNNVRKLEKIDTKFYFYLSRCCILVVVLLYIWSFFVDCQYVVLKIVYMGLLSYLMLFLFVWLLYIRLLYNAWDKHGCDYKKYTPVLLKALIIRLLVPISIWKKLFSFATKKTATKYIESYLFEVIISVAFSMECAFILFFIFLACGNRNIEKIIDLCTPYFLVDTITIMHYCFLFTWILYKVLQHSTLNLLLRLINRKNLDKEGIKQVIRMVFYQIDTYGLIIVLLMTVLLTPLTFSDAFINSLSHSMLYICVIYSTYITLREHIEPDTVSGCLNIEIEQDEFNPEYCVNRKEKAAEETSETDKEEMGKATSDTKGVEQKTGNSDVFFPWKKRNLKLATDSVTTKPGNQG